MLINGFVGAMVGLGQVLTIKKKLIRKMHHRKTSGYIAVLAASVLLVLGSCAPGTTVARSTSPQSTKATPGKKNYAVLISQPNHLKAAVNTAGTFTANSAYNREKFVVMACGKSMEAFVKGSNMEAEFRKGQAAGITYKVCGMSLKQFNIDPGTLVEGIEVEPNGLTYMFELQEQGYTTVEL